MPIYEYRCDACGHELEKIQRMSDAPLKDCPDCDRPELRRLVSAAGFRLKGGGWYETDFKKDSRKNLHDSHAGDKAAGKAKDTPSAKPVSPAKADKTTSAAPAAKPGAA